MTARLVIFDMDGVLADSEAISCEVVCEVLHEHGAAIGYEEVRERFVGKSTESMLQTVAAERGCRFPATIRERIRERSLQAYEGRLRPIEGMPELLRRLETPACVASSSSPPRIDRTLELVGLRSRFVPHLFSASMVENGKPAPDLFLFAAEAMGAKPAECVVVEDSKAGVEAAVAAGMPVIGLTAGSHLDHASHAPRLRALGAAAVVEDAAALEAALAAFL